ncbi:MAG: hypothetical protein OEX14_04930 [Paracoccaceae bacterium]|nr:hypothetical protein [Paracoccaceae bacterium]
MAAFNKFQDFTEQALKAVHNFSAAGHQIDIYLSNATPSAALDAAKADLAEITIANGYTGPVDTANDMTETGGTATVTGTDVTITAAGGSVGPFQYIVYMNQSATAPLDALIGWWDYGAGITLADGESFTVDFGVSVATLV